MKHIFILMAMVFCLGEKSFAQDSILNRSRLPKTVYLNEDFTTHGNGWDECDNVATHSFIKNGIYYYQAKNQDHGRWQWDCYNIDPTQNYYFEMLFAVTHGPEDFGSGLLFNYTTTLKTNASQFLISPNGYFLISQTTDDVENLLKPWTTSRYIQPSGNNRLGVYYKGNYTYFYINDHLVFRTKRLPYAGTGIGLVCAKATTMAIDNFTIRYNPVHVNEIDNAEQGIKTEVLGSNINTKLDQSFPVLSADGKMMFFSRTSDAGHLDIEKTTLMYAYYHDAAKQWLPAVALPANINQGIRVQVVYVSPDKKTILIDGKCDANGKFIKDAKGICISHKTEAGWSDPENVPITGLVNKSIHSAFTVSNSNKAIILSVNTGKSGYGERDLYVSLKQNGVWGVPQNMGAVVNSFGDDFSPCLAPDNITLYYASTGKPGYGKSDIFVTRRLDGTWLNWSEPQNLGPDINSKQGDAGLQVDANGQYAYMNVTGNGREVGKIGKILIPESARPKPVVIVSGKVYNKKTNAPVSTQVMYENMETGNEEGNTVSNAQDGSYVIVLPYGENYGLTAKASGFMAESKNLNMVTDTLKTGFIEVNADIYLTPLEPGLSIKLNNIFFAPDKYDLVETSFSELDRLVGIMNDNPGLTIEVEGHTDKGGENATAQTLGLLSQNRANTVKDYLVSKGIETNRISTVGYGNTRPVSATTQSLNRRVEIKIKDLELK